MKGGDAAKARSSDTSQVENSKNCIGRTCTKLRLSVYWEEGMAARGRNLGGRVEFSVLNVDTMGDLRGGRIRLLDAMSR